MGKCRLKHYEDCPGGIQEVDKGGNAWRACPRGYNPPNEDSTEEEEQDRVTTSDDDMDPEELSVFEKDHTGVTGRNYRRES